MQVCTTTGAAQTMYKRHCDTANTHLHMTRAKELISHVRIVRGGVAAVDRAIGLIGHLGLHGLLLQQTLLLQLDRCCAGS